MIISTGKAVLFLFLSALVTIFLIYGWKKLAKKVDIPIISNVVSEV